MSAKGILMYGCHVIRFEVELSQQWEACKLDFSILVFFDELWFNLWQLGQFVLNLDEYVPIRLEWIEDCWVALYAYGCIESRRQLCAVRSAQGLEEALTIRCDCSGPGIVHTSKLGDASKKHEEWEQAITFRSEWSWAWSSGRIHACDHSNRSLRWIHVQVHRRVSMDQPTSLCGRGGRSPTHPWFASICRM
jgi:hypothetical protein